MLPFFIRQKECEKLTNAAKSWLGTPFRYRQSCKGRGVDCAFLIAAILHEAGVTGLVSFAHYDWDWYACFKDDRVQNIILDGVKAALNPGLTVVAMPPGTEPEAGDVVTFLIKPALTANHMAIMLCNGQFVHANLREVEAAEFDERWRERLKCVYRIFKGVN